MMNNHFRRDFERNGIGLIGLLSGICLGDREYPWKTQPGCLGMAEIRTDSLSVKYKEHYNYSNLSIVG
jgi:hypothetical protein